MHVSRMTRGRAAIAIRMVGGVSLARLPITAPARLWCQPRGRWSGSRGHRDHYPGIASTKAARLSDPHCIFCKVVVGEAPGTILYEDDIVVVFLDINPVTPGHMMVVPRAHLPALADIDAETGGHLFNVAQRMAAALRESGLRCDGVNLFYADGEAAFQEVFHAHLHVIPRFEGDGFKLSADWETQPSRPELEAVGEQIRNALDGTTTNE